MIAYKWVIKRKGKYYSLINFRIFPTIKKKFPSYEIGQVYNSPINLRPEHRRDESGFYFWKKPTNGFLKSFNNFLKSHKQPQINAVLKCKISEQNLLADGVRGAVRAKEFKVLKEVKL